MRVSLIVAMGLQRQIGFEQTIPWRLPADLKNFKQLTMGHHLVMGRKTFESLKKPLPGRTSIVLSRDLQFNPDTCIVKRDLDEAFAFAKSNGETEVFVAGGQKIYEAALPLIDRMYLSRVEIDCKADTFFPEYDAKQWKTVSSIFHAADEHAPAWTFETLDRI